MSVHVLYYKLKLVCSLIILSFKKNNFCKLYAVMYADDSTLLGSTKRPKVNILDRKQIWGSADYNGSQWPVSLKSSKTQRVIHSRLKKEDALSCSKCPIMPLRKAMSSFCYKYSLTATYHRNHTTTKPLLTHDKNYSSLIFHQSAIWNFLSF